MPGLKLSWLGPPALESDGQRIRLEMRKPLAILAYLSLSAQYATRESLAALFWPEYNQQHALASLRRSLFSLNSSLPPGLLETERDRVGLQKVDWLDVDVVAFRQLLAQVNEHLHNSSPGCPDCLASLEQAAEIYHGDFMEGFNLKDCPAFDEWQLYQRQALRSDFEHVLEQLAAHYQSGQNWEKAVACSRHRVALDPLNEAAQRTLIDLYARSGQRRLAVRQYETLVGLLQSELGQAPEPETLALAEPFTSPGKPASGQVSRVQPPSAPPAAEPLVKTKLYIPPVRPNQVLRSRLFDQLDAGVQRSMTLLSAPAGFGKTTLLAGWVAHTGLPVAWFSTDDGDNDPVRFVAYLVAALESILPSGMLDNLGVFSQSLQPSIQSTLVQLINCLAAHSEQLVLVLDDYQAIHSIEVHQAVEFLVERIPPCVHMVIATRTDPPLSLARLRARDQLVEIRMADLRFSPEESTSFLVQSMDLSLSSDDLSALEARTEGWIAGLQMAGLAIRTVAKQQAAGSGAVTRFIHEFSGSNRYILDYLSQEVLERCSPHVRSFLCETSILEHLSGPLCDAVTSGAGSQELLEELENENLFLVPLDGDRHWYRYHSIFAELLQIKLVETLARPSASDRDGLAGLETLHSRAAGWCERNQLPGEAVRHYIAAGEYQLAAGLIESMANRMIFVTGESFTLLSWCAALPEDLLKVRPRLAIARAWASISQSHFQAAAELVEFAQQAVAGSTDPQADSILGEIALVRGGLAELSTRDVEVMRSQGLLAWQLLPEGDSMLRGLAAWLLGVSYLYAGDTQPAEDYLKQAIALCRASGNTFFQFISSVDYCNVLREQGRYRQAYQLLVQTLTEMTAGGRPVHPGVGYIYHGLSLILYAWNELDEAEHFLKLGIDQVAQDIPAEILIFCLASFSMVKLAQGDLAEARRLAEEALARAEAYPLPYVPSAVKARLVRFWIRVGDQEQLAEWLSGCQLQTDDPISYAREDEYTALARVLHWQGDARQALDVLSRLHNLAQGQERDGKLIQVLALQALAYGQLGELENALALLEKSLSMAEPEAFIRLYVDEGQSMEALLQAGMKNGRWQRAGLDGYVSRLLDIIHEEMKTPAG